MEKSRIQFLYEQNTKWDVLFKSKGTWKQAAARRNDAIIMDKLFETTQPTYIMERLNDVHLLLMVTMLSDIANEKCDQFDD